MRKEILRLTVVRKIAAALAGNVDLLSGLLVLLENRDLVSVLRSRSSSH